MGFVRWKARKPIGQVIERHNIKGNERLFYITVILS